MSDEHTAGPWIPTWHMVNRQGRWCCWLKDRHGNKVARAYGRTKAIAEANARLIAESPELLEVLKELKDEAFMNMAGGRGDLIDRAESVIAKAETAGA